jgi:hypothetical protein
MKKLLALPVVAFAVAGTAVPSASASPSGDVWNLANGAHTAAGCPPYTDNAILGNTALSIAKTMLNPPGGIAGNGRVPADVMLASAGYNVSSWGEADYIQDGGTPQKAMDFWMSQGTRDIFPNCNNKDMATAVWVQNGKFAAVLLAASPGGNPGTPPHVG